MDILLMLGLFIVVGGGAGFAASRLAIYAEGVKEKTRTSYAFIGFLIGVAISLPELTSSVTAIAIDSPDIAVGNLVGSNLFNIMGLAIFDVVYRKHQIMSYATQESKLYGWLVILITLAVMLGLTLTLPSHFFHISYTSILIVLIYFVGAHYINNRTEYQGRKISRGKGYFDRYSYKQVMVRFIAGAIGIMVLGSILTIVADRLAVMTGLGASFVGSFLVAASTSLPDAVSVGTALKMRNFNLAISSLLGSNAFNLMILAFTDGIYFQGNLLHEASKANIITAAVSILFILLLLYSITRRHKRRMWVYLIPSLLIIVFYFVATYLVFELK
ncbi:sodium:calcium antiporter [Thalassobacillus sp. CUG 92003]|uniref:sodium:calcium antiporter n=1 Tax=Thalassobacillus sp. CUG 92003 TaxID=2736641 RepID=UPI0015E74B6A|nr:sodium:calcium antiporter [Thalassobacillus sp. CUG 92003]